MNPEEYGKKIGVTFKNKDLIVEALTHRSYLNEYPKWALPHNERLEYLGDAVLELIVTEALFRKFPKQAEGQLTVLRAALVNYQILARVAESIDLQDFVLLSRGERKDTGRAREVILANAIEAVIQRNPLNSLHENPPKIEKRELLDYVIGNTKSEHPIIYTGSYEPRQDSASLAPVPFS